MTTINTDFGTGGQNLTPGGASGSPDLATTLRDIAADLAELRTQFVALLGKMDTDFTAQNLAVAGSQLDTNYAATLTPDALETVAG